MLQLNFIVIPLITITIALSGSFYTSHNLTWYQIYIKKPRWTPPGAIIGFIWTILYVLTTISALGVWNTFPRTQQFYVIIAIFVVNAVLNFLWSYLFFAKHELSIAYYEAMLMAITIAGLIILIWPTSQVLSMLLIPYFIWVCFAAFLNRSILNRNKVGY